MKVRDPQAIKRWRLHAGFTQAELAALCKCTQPTIHLLETGKLMAVTDALAQHIARRLHVPLEDLFVAQASAPVVDEVKNAHTSRRHKSVA